MKNSKSLIAAIVMATASLGASAAFAADISSAPKPLDLIDNSAFYGDSFGMNNQSNTFSDRFTFSVGSTPLDLDAIVASVSRTARTGLDITGMSLFSGGGTGTGTLVNAGSMRQSGMADVWVLTADALNTGSYYVEVSGRLVSDTAGSFGGSIMLAPVPEPETYAMMLAGLGLLGFAVRRRSSKQS